MAAPHLFEMTHAQFEGVYFTIRSDGNDVRLPGWSQPNMTATRHYPGTNRSVTFQMGRGPMQLAYRVEFHSRADHEAMQALIGLGGTLQIPRRICELPQTPEDEDGNRAVVDVDYFGTIYTRISDVMLMSVGAPLSGDGEYIETTLAFQRNERPE